MTTQNVQLVVGALLVTAATFFRLTLEADWSVLAMLVLGVLLVLVSCGTQETRRGIRSIGVHGSQVNSSVNISSNAS